MPVKLARNVFVPAWIMIFGLVSLLGHPLGVSLSVSLGAVGILVIPALILASRPGASGAAEDGPSRDDAACRNEPGPSVPF